MYKLYLVSLLSIEIGVMVLLVIDVWTPRDILGSTVEIPTYSDKYPVTGPNGTIVIDFENGTITD